MQTMLLATNTENNSSSQQLKNVLENCKPLNIFFFVDGWLITRCTVLVAGIFIKKPFKKTLKNQQTNSHQTEKFWKYFPTLPIAKNLLSQMTVWINLFLFFCQKKKKDKKTNDDFGNNAAFND